MEKKWYKAKSVEDKLDMLARQNVSLGGLNQCRLQYQVINRLPPL